MVLAFLAFAWSLGIATAAFTGADPLALGAAAAMLGAVSFALRPRFTTLALIAAGCTLVFLAGWRYDATVPVDPATTVSRLNDDGPVQLRALVDAEPEERPSTRLYRLMVREAYVDGEWRSESGGILMRTAHYPQYEYGDVLEIEGELQTPPVFPEFDYRDYLMRQGVGSLLAYPKVEVVESGQGNAVRARLISIRSSLNEAIEDALPEPQSSLAASILFGARVGLSPDLRNDMNTTGTSHMVAVSGHNVSIIAGVIIGGLAWVTGRRPAAWFALAVIVFYAALVGGQPSVVRAAIMGSLYITAVATGRQSAAAPALVIAAAVMTAFDPQIAHDVSFQLSFAATLGLITTAPLLQARAEWLLPQRVLDFPGARPLLEVGTITLAAIAFTLPIVAVNFGRVSLVAPVANLFVVPAFVAVGLTAAFTAIVGVIIPGSGVITGWIAWPPATYMVAAVRFFASPPLASLEVSGVTVVHAIVYYALLAAGVWAISRRRVERPQPEPVWSGPRPLVPAAGIALVLALASVAAWLVVTAPESGRLTVTVLDVGQGDAILVEGPEGHRILIDGGPNGDAVTAALGRRLPFYDRRIDLIVLTHPDADHLAGLPAVLDRYKVRGVLDSAAENDTALFAAWQDALELLEVPVVAASRGQSIDLGGGAMLSVLAPGPGFAPDSPNEASTVLRVAMGDAVFLLTGDIESDGESYLVRSGSEVGAQVLKVPHHGSSTSSTVRFLDRVQPALSVISVGAENRYGHPAVEVLERLEHTVVLRTDEHGDVAISTDGERLWVGVGRGKVR